MGKRNRGPLIRETYENGKLMYVDVFTGKRLTPEEFAYWKKYFDFYYRKDGRKRKGVKIDKIWKKYLKDKQRKEFR